LDECKPPPLARSRMTMPFSPLNRLMAGSALEYARFSAMKNRHPSRFCTPSCH
jgi:hypothetical protein